MGRGPARKRRCVFERRGREEDMNKCLDVGMLRDR